MDLERLNGHYLFGMNKIQMIFEQVPLDLSYHVCVNPLVIEQSLEDFRKLDCPSFLAYRDVTMNLPPSEPFYYLSTGNAPFGFSETILVHVFEGWTVTYVALQIAYYMGFERVFLVGVDHNFKVEGKPNEKQLLEEDDSNHFAPGYFKGHQWQLPDLEGSEIAYRMAKFFFERDGRQVIDATVEGKLQVFPKIDYDEALHRCRSRENET